MLRTIIGKRVKTNGTSKAYMNCRHSITVRQFFLKYLMLFVVLGRMSRESRRFLFNRSLGIISPLTAKSGMSRQH